MAEKKMLSIWFFVGLMLLVFGLIVTITGIIYIFDPQHRTALSHLNPNLWWGGVMVIAGLAFLIPSIIHHKKENNEA